MYHSDSATTSVHSVVSANRLTQDVGTGEGVLRILDEVSFSILAGESVAIVGASGSGKSTLLGLLAGLDNASAGDVLLAGISLSSLDEEARARLRAEKVGFVFQNFQLLPALTALENVMLPLEILGKEDVRLVAEQWLKRVGLQDRLHHTPQKLSGGEQQRVAIARAFALQPAILFADEPTGNLDTATGERIAHLLFELNQQQGTTLILVTHDQLLASRCSRRIQLAAGRLISDSAEKAVSDSAEKAISDNADISA